MHLLALGVRMAWCKSWEVHTQHAAADAEARASMHTSSAEASRVLQRCEAWLLAAVRDMSRAHIPAAEFAEVPAVPAAAPDAVARVRQSASVSVSFPLHNLALLHACSCVHSTVDLYSQFSGLHA